MLDSLKFKLNSLKEKEIIFDKQDVPLNLKCLVDKEDEVDSFIGNLSKFTFLPNHGNLGDALIAAATYQLFEKKGLDYKVYPECYGNTIVYGGGGIWTSEYKKTWTDIIEIFKRFKNIIILPSSFYKCDEFFHEIDERYIIFCRDATSYEYVTSQNSKARVLLANDMAFRCNSDVFNKKIKITKKHKKVLSRINELLYKKGRIIFALRNDNEKTNEIVTTFDISGIWHNGFLESNDAFFGALLLVAIINSYDVIITDRLHVAIASLMLQKSVFCIDNNYGKLTSVLEFSAKNNPHLYLDTLSLSFQDMCLINDRTATNDLLLKILSSADM